MRWTLEEFLLELDLDPQRRVLFVEGDRDLAFWREIIPTLLRENAVVYPISVLQIPDVPGGERGRAIACAGITAAHRQVRYFVDADYDRILGVHHMDSVILTDARDLEGYALTQVTLGTICRRWFAREDDGAEALLFVSTLGRPLAALRVLSARQALNLPFRRTFENRRLDRYLAEGEAIVLNINRVLRALLQNSLGLDVLDELVVSYANEQVTLAAQADDQIIHGKDAIWILAWYFEIERNEMERLLYCCVDYLQVRNQPNIRIASQWLMNQQAAG